MKKILEKLLLKKRVTLFFQILIVISVISFSIETLPDLTEKSKIILRYVEFIIIIFFTLEYLARIYITEKKLKFIFSFYGIIDLFAILPFYLSTWLDLRSLRILRFFRLFRLFKLLRYSKAINNFKKTILSIKEELVLFSILTLMLLYLAAVWIYYFENEDQPENFRSIFDSLWWAVATLTTVWYGDVYPITAWWKAFTFLILMIWLWIVAIPTGLIAGAIDNHNEE